jgi:hypothetical protein
MAMQANTSGVLLAVSGYLQGAQINGLPVYKTVAEGIIKDITNTVPCAMVFLAQDGSVRDYLGGRIHDPQCVHILSVVDYTNALAAELQIASIRDAIVAIFQERARLGDTPLVYTTTIKDKPFTFGFMKVDGVDYRTHEMALEVTQEYSVPVGPGTA